MTLGTAGIVWLVFYLVALVAILLRAKKKEVRSEGESSPRPSARQRFYIARGTKLGRVVLTLTFAATLFSAFFMIGLPGFLYTHGLGTWPYVIFGDVLGMLALFYVGRRVLILKNKETLSPLELILPTKLSKVLFVGVTTIFILPYLAVQISGFGRLVSSATNGEVSVVLAAAIGLAIMFIYSAITGIKGIVLTDAVQGTVLFFCSFMVGGYITFGQFDGPADLLHAVYLQVPALLGAPGPRGFFTAGALVSGCILFASIPISQPQFLTRYLIIHPDNDIQYLRTIALGFGFLLAIAALAIIPIGLGGAILYPDLTSGDALLGQILASFDSDFGRVGGGLFVVGVLAAAMSTVDSILFSLGHYFAVDIYSGVMGNKEGDSVLVGRVFIFGVAIVAFFLGIGNTDLIVYLSSLSFQGTLQLVPAVICGLWKVPVRRYTASASIIVGMVSLFIFQSFNPLVDLGLSPAIPAFVLSSVLCIISWRMSKDTN